MAEGRVITSQEIDPFLNGLEALLGISLLSLMVFATAKKVHAAPLIRTSLAISSTLLLFQCRTATSNLKRVVVSVTSLTVLALALTFLYKKINLYQFTVPSLSILSLSTIGICLAIHKQKKAGVTR